MKRLTQTLPLLLAAALQILPLLRNLVTSPAASSTFAFILRWGIGSTAAIGAVDAVSGATTGISMTSTNHIYGTNGTYMSNNIVIVISGGNTATASDFEYVSTTSGTLVSSSLLNGQSTTNGCLPPGLIFKCNLPTSTSTIGGYLYGTPTNAASGSTSNITLTIWGNGSAHPTNLVITVLAAAAGVAPNITNQPVSLTNLVSSNVNFSVTAGGTAPLSYQWYFNTNTTLLNATNTSLSLTNIQLTNAGNYRVIITNSSGSVTSSYASLTVWQPPVITNQPIVGATNLVGTTNTLFNVVAGGTPAPTYQWYFNTNTLLTGQTAATLTLTNLQLTNAGYYRCTITNSAGTTNSANALLTVWQPPVITNQPISGATNLVGTTNTLFNVVAGGTPAPTYQWYFNTNTLLTGQTAATLTLTNLQLTNAGYYRCTITNSAGGTNSANALLTIWQPPVITNQPASTTNTAGQTVNFSVTAGGTTPLSYKWLFNTNAALLNATNATLSLTNARLSQAGTYSVVITNVAGGVTSSPAILGIKLPTVSAIATPTATNGYFQFIFTPVVGLTNSVLTNSTLTTGTWAVLTNVPPPATAAPVTVTDQSSSAGRYYRVQVIP